MSRYSNLLATIIAESGLTAKEIVEKCNEMGNGIDATRLSKLQSGKLPAPSEKVSRDIAKVCNVDERKLVIEGYIEKAPQEIIDAFTILKNNTAISILKLLGTHATAEQIENIKKELDKEPLSDYVVELLDSENDQISVNPEGFDVKSKDFRFRIEEPLALPVKDNAMFPLIVEKSKVSLKLEKEYHNGDILAIRVKDNEDVIFRYVLFNNDNIILTPLNKEFETLTYKLNEVKILGKVIKEITSI